MNVYFVRSDNGLVKIGVAKNIKQRLSILEKENASKIELLGVMEGGFELEKDIQEKFKNTRSHGEWFKLTKDLNEFIARNSKLSVDKIKSKKQQQKKEEKRTSRAICLDDWEKQIIYGALLGQAFIVDPPKGLHCYLVIRQSKTQDINVFLYKIMELRAFSRQSSVYTDGWDRRWTSIAHQDFDILKSFCYKDKNKKVTMDWLNVLRDVSLMVWYLDKGFYKDGVLGINISNIKESKEIIHSYFNEVGMPCDLKNNTIYFTEKGKEKFLRIIAHRVPEALHYRLIN